MKDSGGFDGIFVAAMKIKQRDGSDCVPACFGFVADYYRLRLPLAQIRQIVRTDAARTMALGLVVVVAANLGFQAKDVRWLFENLANVPKPAIAHLKLQEDRFHFVVLWF